MIKKWLETYQPTTVLETEQALREIMQEIALAGLQRAGFFEVAAFYGGTALRIFYGLERFSEDLDFSLLKPTTSFSMQPYLEGIVKEFEALGMFVNVQEKIKVGKSNIDSAFLRSDTIWKELILEGFLPQSDINVRPTIKIKIEVDTQPPLGFETEEKLLLQPFSFYVKCFKLEYLFAGKMHALLFRKWKQRVKGRDWYDMEWYIKNKVTLDLNHFVKRANASGDWKENEITKEQIVQLLQAKIDVVNLKSVKEDISRFIKDDNALAIWSPQYFNDLILKIKCWNIKN
jgi:predicted nucleotidyltransferase component of viral defense system